MRINLIDARRGLHNYCLELFADKKIAEQIYRYLCNGIEDCEEAEPMKHGRWEQIVHPWYECSECGERTAVVNLNGEVVWNYCPNCGARMNEVEE